ncbi:MAG: PadR family transcriptional regulator [Candidatus Hodarchaeota archaeon]
MYAKLSIDEIAYSYDMSSRDVVVDQILLVLDRLPCHGYELRRQLAPIIGDIELTTLYRWLHAMEKEGLVDSEMQVGPHGPFRRVYRIGTRGENRLRRILRDAIGVVLHFYDAYRHFTLQERFKLDVIDVAQGPVLVNIVSHLLAREVELIQFLGSRTGGEPLHILGDLGVWSELKLELVRIDGISWDIACRNEWFAEVWILGVPPREWLPRAIVEVKRVLQPGGMLRMIAPFVFFDEPTEETLEAFIRVTAYHMFPELGVAEGLEISTVFEKHFDRNGVIQIFPGYVDFWGIKKPESHG